MRLYQDNTQMNLNQYEESFLNEENSIETNDTENFKNIDKNKYKGAFNVKDISSDDLTRAQSILETVEALDSPEREIEFVRLCLSQQ